MIPTAYINIYSGMRNPEKELSDEEADTLRDLVSKLEYFYHGQAHYHLGFSGYSAFLGEDLYVIASLHGFIQVFRKDGAITFSDTTGVLAYLCKLMAPIMIRHNKDALGSMQQWIDPTWIYQPPPWEPQF